MPEPSISMGTKIAAPGKKSLVSFHVNRETSMASPALNASNSDTKSRKTQEVARVKHDHYQNKRFRKLSQLVKTAEQIAFEKRIEREQPDEDDHEGQIKKLLMAEDYYKQYGKRLNVIGTERGENQYKQKFSKMLTA